MERDGSDRGLEPFARVPDHVVTEDLGDTGLILDLRKSRYCSLDSVGFRMFTLVRELPTINDVVDSLSREYDGDVDTIRRDLTKLVERLVREGLLVVGSRGAG